VPLPAEVLQKDGEDSRPRALGRIGLVYGVLGAKGRRSRPDGTPVTPVTLVGHPVREQNYHRNGIATAICV